MSLYIQGMKLPKDEKAIHLEVHSDGIVLMWQMGDNDKVVGTAIEVAPHGRLCDLDAFFEDFAELRNYEEASREYDVIPADKEGGADNG